MPRQPKRGTYPDAVSTTGRRKPRKNRIVPLPVTKEEHTFLETYEQDTERPGPDSTAIEPPDGTLPPPDRSTPD